MNLSEWLEHDRRLGEQLEVVEGLSIALENVHHRGDLHRLLTPANVDVTPDRRCTLNSDGVSPDPGRYRAPEVAEGGQHSRKSDIYSLGVILYEMLSGKHPYAGKPGTAAPRLTDLRPDVPRELADAISACIEKDPEWRPADLSYLLEVVRRLRAELPRSALDPGKEPGSRREAAEGGLPLLPIAVGIGLAAAAGAWLWLRSARSAAPVAPAAAPVVEATPSAPAPDAQKRPRLSAVVPPRSPSPSAGSPSPIAGAPAVKPGPPTPAQKASPPATGARASAEVASPPSPEAARPEVPKSPEPAAEPAAAAPAPKPQEVAVATPASLSAIAPFRVRRGALAVLDVHGSGLRPDHQARVLRARGREPAEGFAVTRQKFVSNAMMLVFLQLGADVAPGKYAFALADPEGRLTNSLMLEVTK